MINRFVLLVFVCLPAMLISACGGSDSSSGVTSNSVLYGKSATNFAQYVQNYPDLLVAYNAGTGQSIEAWGQSHYCASGKAEGRAYSGSVDCSSTTTSNCDMSSAPSTNSAATEARRPCVTPSSGSSSSGVTPTASVAGNWVGTWRSNHAAQSYMTGSFSQAGSGFSGVVVIGGSYCFGRELASGVILNSSLDFNIGEGGQEPPAPGFGRTEAGTIAHAATVGGVVGISFNATISGNQIAGSYRVLSTACAGDYGTFVLSRN